MTGMYAYKMSKTAANMLGVCLANDLRSSDVAVVVLSPGFVDTGAKPMLGCVSACLLVYLPATPLCASVAVYVV